MSIQSLIDSQITDPKKVVLRVVIEGESGDANVPANINVDFRACTVGALTTAGNSRINVEGGTLASATLVGTALLTRNATVSGDVTASAGSKLTYDTVTVDGKTTLDGSVMTSKHCTYSKEAFSVTNASKVRSTMDTFKAKIGTADGSFSTIELFSPTITGDGLPDLTGMASLVIDGGTATFTDAGTITDATVEIRNCSTFKATNLWTADSSRIVLRKMPTVETSNGITASKGSVIEVIDVQTIKADQTLFTLDASRLEVTRFTLLSSPVLVLDASNNSGIRIANGTDLKSDTKIATMASGSKLLVDKVTNVVAPQLFTSDLSTVAFVDNDLVNNSSGSGIQAGGSTISFTNVKTLKASSGLILMSSDGSLSIKGSASITNSSGTFITGQGQGSILISGCADIEVHGFIITDNIFTVTIDGCGTIHTGDGAIATMTAFGGSVLNVSSCQALFRDGDKIFDLTGTDCFLTALPSVTTSVGGKECITAVPGDSGQQQMQVSKCIVDGFNVTGYSVDLFASQFNKFAFTDCDIRMRRNLQLNGQGESDAKFVTSSLIDQFGEWTTDIYGDNAALMFLRPKQHAKFHGKNKATFRVDNAQMTSGYQNNGSGAAFFASGWVPDDIAAHQDDAHSLYLAGAPGFSGSGSLFVMAGEPCDVGLLNYILLKHDDIRILDSRNCFEDFTNNINRHAPDDINDSALGNYTLQADTATENADQNFDITGQQRVTANSSAKVALVAPEVDAQSS